ncbi:trigger factor [Xylella taiwanensis]|uniref:Trigger factor n=1 Tax=Xylella taiwanensis TaxID=1444770 RepID=Z9JKZ6_9GAMM|nr:trigger factor [Xylella taiwanensis]AXI82989.1 trigger factor [Xylella taiwanensis]EWS78442.1 trigger factor [Xylella taiwanensis]MCD8456014.1 trigger factor [Xylella taiwanensis]MCD8458418.1 trigger factor [Xylella taiwanensis]MCD8460555.1 trigger factor [Xylella taiwanensis]
MQVSIESIGNLERRLTFSVPEDRLESHVDERLREIARTARINGFRPGKVPAKVIEQRFGEKVRAEVLDSLLRETLDSAIRANSLRLAGATHINRADEGKFNFVATFEVMPDFGEIDVSKLSVVRRVAKVTDADIDQMIENLRLQRRIWRVTERGAQVGDLVTLETWSQAGDERLPTEGMEAGSTVLGSGVMFEQIERALEGSFKGEEKVLDVAFPDDWRVTQLAGKAVQVHVKVIEVSEPVLLEVNEEFIKSFGVKSGKLEDFCVDIRANLERELKGALVNHLRREVGEQLIAAYTHIEMPPRLVESEARLMLAKQVEQIRLSGRDPVDIPDDAHLGFMDAACKRVLVGLLVGEIAGRNRLRLDPMRVTETLHLIASTYEEPEEVLEMYRNNPKLMESVQSLVMEEQVIEWIAERAQHTEQVLSFQEAIQQ